MADLLTRDQAGRVLGMTREGVRKLEGTDLTPVRSGRLVCFERGEVEAVRAKRGARVPIATKAEREAEREADKRAREEAAALRAEEREAKRAAHQASLADRREVARINASWERENALEKAHQAALDDQRAKEDALRALSDAFKARTVTAGEAAAILGTTRREVDALQKAGVLPYATHEHGEELARFLPVEPRFDREEVWRVKRETAAAQPASTPAPSSSSGALPALAVLALTALVARHATARKT